MEVKKESTACSQKSFLEKLRLPHMTRQHWVTLLLLGVLLAVISLPTGEKSKTGLQADKSTGNLFTDSTNARNSSNLSSEEKSVLERKLESLLSGVEGVGETQVLLVTQDESPEGYFQSGSQKVTGVLISARGADNSITIQNIKEAVMALFQIEAHRIKVMKMK